MRKSSLGRRSSTQIPVRVPSLGGSTARPCSGKKNTGSLLKPGVTPGRRSQSADRETIGFGGSRPMQRSNTFGTMTPQNPPRASSLYGGLPSGGARAPKGQMTSDSVKRMSSFGGGGKRKDTRPITEKAFQQEAQGKVQRYFDLYAPDVIGHGNSIRPMNTKLFVDMMNHFLENLDSRIVITRSNYLEDLPPLLRKLAYRSKVDRSWLMTVNTPHSWPHVIAVLSWLVDLKEIMEATDPFEIMYSNVDDENTEEEETEDDIKIDRELVHHLKKSYKMRNDADRIAILDEEYFDKQIEELKCTDEDLETLQREIDLIKEDIENEVQRKNMVNDELQKHQEKCKGAINDYEKMKEYIEKTKHFIDCMKIKQNTRSKEVLEKRAILEKKKEELMKIKEKVNTQEISRDEMEKLNSERNNLQRMINFHENTIREYQNSAFNADIKLADDQKKLEKIVLEYSKLLAEKVVLEPKLKDCEMELQLLSNTSTRQTIDSNFKMLKKEYKNHIDELETKKVESETILKRVIEDVETTNKTISVEAALVEKIESDFEKQKEFTTKESKKLEDSLIRTKEMSEAVSEELAQSQLDPAKLNEKRQKLIDLQDDYQLLQRKSKEYLEGVVDILKEEVSEIVPCVQNLMGTLEKMESEL